MTNKKDNPDTYEPKLYHGPIYVEPKTQPETSQSQTSAADRLQQIMGYAARRPGFAFLTEPEALRSQLHETMTWLDYVITALVRRQETSYIQFECLIVTRILEIEVIPQLVDLTNDLAIGLGLKPDDEADDEMA